MTRPGIAGDAEEDAEFELRWRGKREARRLSMTPAAGTLRACPEDSVAWATTRNRFIEGDNLEVLKLLRQPYGGAVKTIYIDPPYNTGREFVYSDDFRGSGRGRASNGAASARRHTNWLNMIYPRLHVARDLLRDDGVLFVSVDDGELANLRLVCSELFGEESFVVQIVWRKRSTPPNDKVIGANHDYIVCYAKDVDRVRLNLRERSEAQRRRYRNPDGHPKGPWVAGDLMANVKGGRHVPTLHFPIVNPATGEEHYPGVNGNWRFSPRRIAELLAGDEIYFGADGAGRPKLKRFLRDVKPGVTYPSIWDFVPLNTEGSREMDELFGSPTIFESPKPVGLLRELLKLSTGPDDLVLDFFAGSASTGHAVMEQNAEDGGRRPFILVQLPSPVPAGSEAERAGFATVADLARERLRRAGKRCGGGDTGFRAYALA
ncbi:MAG TPA: site-specific DNA-methyltransferase [Solirubrobacteraceae bacterium]|nr:site-specific DNA-methyltransferase [Solirubrobacteraceae bacterium]